MGGLALVLTYSSPDLLDAYDPAVYSRNAGGSLMVTIHLTALACFGLGFAVALLVALALIGLFDLLTGGH